MYFLDQRLELGRLSNKNIIPQYSVVSGTTSDPGTSTETTGTTNTHDFVRDC